MSINFNVAAIITPLDIVIREKEVTRYIGEYGYFGNTVANIIEHVKSKPALQLMDVDRDPDACFPFKSGLMSGWFYFLPADKVKTKKPKLKYRPFRTYKEFTQETSITIGEALTFKPKKNSHRRCELLCGVDYDADETDQGLYFASLGYIPFQKLFEDFEYQRPGMFPHDWLPLGVKENG